MLVCELTQPLGGRAGERSRGPWFTPGESFRLGTFSSFPYLNRTYDSYDHGAAIRETRALSDKFDELKRQGLFLRSSPEFRKTDWIGDTSTGIPGVALNGSAAFVTLLKNPDSGTQFLIARQNDSTSTYVFGL